MLVRLGAINDTKGEKFVENPAILQQDFSGTNDSMHRQVSSHGISDIAQTTADSSHLSANGRLPQNKLHTSPRYIPSKDALIDAESSTSPSEYLIHKQEALNLLEFQTGRQCASKEIDTFDELDIMTTAGHDDLFLGNLPTIKINGSTALDCMSHFWFTSSRNDQCA